MEHIPATMDRHLEVIQCSQEKGILLGASSLTGRYWYGSLWYYENPEDAPDVEKCTAGVQLEAGLGDACWVGSNKALVGMDTGCIALWELTDDNHTFIQQNSVTEHDDMVSSVSVCQGEKTAVSASHDRSIKIWDLETCSSVHTYTAHAGPVMCVHCHSQQPSVLLSVAQDGCVCLWDTRNAKPVSRLDKSPLQTLPTCVSWRPGVEYSYAVGSDSGQLVVRDTRAAVTDTVTCSPHHRIITRLQFSSQRNSLLATVSEDCSVIVTDISEESPKQMYRDTSHRDFVRGVWWSESLKLYTCGWDSIVKKHTEFEKSDTACEADSEQSKMEVNGDVMDSSIADTASCAEKVLANGAKQNKAEDLLDSQAPVTVAS